MIHTLYIASIVWASTSTSDCSNRDGGAKCLLPLTLVHLRARCCFLLPWSLARVTSRRVISPRSIPARRQRPGWKARGSRYQLWASDAPTKDNARMKWTVDVHRSQRGVGTLLYLPMHSSARSCPHYENDQRAMFNLNGIEYEQVGYTRRRFKMVKSEYERRGRDKGRTEMGHQTRMNPCEASPRKPSSDHGSMRGAEAGLALDESSSSRQSPRAVGRLECWTRIIPRELESSNMMNTRLTKGWRCGVHRVLI